MARPDVCTDEVLMRLCARYAAGRPLRAICNDDDMPRFDTVLGWLMTSDAARTAFDRARRLVTELLVQEAVAIADSVADPRSLAGVRLRIETRQWAVAERGRIGAVVTATKTVADADAPPKGTVFH
ncbi:MAG: hypothetical protein ACM30I_01765 [Gemmatimonas sp.]